MTAPTATRVPAALRLARIVTVTQAVLASALATVALVFAGVARHHDAVARHAGHPNEYDGLGVAIGLYVAVLCGFVALPVGIAAIGLCRGRTWGLATTVVVESAAVLFSAAVTVESGGTLLSSIVLVPSAIALLGASSPRCWQWCRQRGLA